ncbi:MAG: TrkA family potassium uptake protein [Flavobacteriales bacterium]|nr:TrkA family potassium uptake protein [Flavobacteriales bacterium]
MGIKKFAVIGVGKYGSQIAKEIAGKGAEVIAMDTDVDKIEAIKEDVAVAIVMDTTDKKAMMGQQVDQVDAGVVAIGENFEATILTALNLLDLGVKRVIVRASGENQIRILKNLGIREILTPESEVASNVAERLIHPNITAFLQLPDGYEIAEVRAPGKVVNRTLEDVGIDSKYGLRLITLKREYQMRSDSDEVEIEEHIIGVPKSETVIYESDTLVVFGTLKNIQRFIEINE